MKTQEYTFEKDGETIIVPLERWAWRVTYEPTEAQLQRAKEETIAHRKEVLKEGDKQLRKLRRDGGSDIQLAQMKNAIEDSASREIQPRCDELRQFDNTGKFHQFAEIDQSRVTQFTMYRLDRSLKQHSMMVDASDDVQLFQFARNIVLAATTPSETRYRIFVFGLKHKSTGVTVYNYILPDDRVLTSLTDIADLRSHLELTT